MIFGRHLGRIRPPSLAGEALLSFARLRPRPLALSVGPCVSGKGYLANEGSPSRKQ